MLLLKYLLLTLGIALLVAAAAVIAYDVYPWIRARVRSRTTEGPAADAVITPAPLELRTGLAARYAIAGIVALLISASFEVVPSGSAGVRVSQFSGTKPETLYPGVHYKNPLLDSIVLYDTRTHVLTTGDTDGLGTDKKKSEPLKVTAREGLNIGFAVTVRYRLDPKRLAYIHSNLPHPVETELVPPVVATVFREVIPNYNIREVFAAKREEIRREATDEITRRLAQDGIIVDEVMLRDIILPPDYAKGLEDLIAKEQQSERMNFEAEIQKKQVEIAQFEAEAQKVREVKRAEGDAQVQVLQAKAQSDAMQYTLPLKQKQIEQSRLEAEARKEATIKNAEASAQAKVIDSKAELERRRLMADAEANRIRVTAAADNERLRGEALALKGNPLLINKIVAERLSDKIQVMMVPADGKFFFANDVLKSPMQQMMKQDDDNGGDDPAADDPKPADPNNTSSLVRRR